MQPPTPFTPRSAAPRAAALIAGATFVLGLALGTGSHGCTVLTNDALPDDASTDAANDAGLTCSSCFSLGCGGLFAACLGDDLCIAQRFCGSGGNADAGDASIGDALADAAAPTPIERSPLYPHVLSCQALSACAVKVQSCVAPFSASCAATDAGTDAASLDAAMPQDAATDAGDAALVDADVLQDGATDTSEAGSVDAAADAMPVSCADCAAQCASACAAGSVCDAYVQCALGCDSVACVSACAAKNAAGKGAAVEVARCVTSKCAATCGRTE